MGTALSGALGAFMLKHPWQVAKSSLGFGGRFRFRVFGGFRFSRLGGMFRLWVFGCFRFQGLGVQLEDYCNMRV